MSLKSKSSTLDDLVLPIMLHVCAPLPPQYIPTLCNCLIHCLDLLKESRQDFCARHKFKKKKKQSTLLLTKSSHHHPASQSIQRHWVISWIITFKRQDHGLNGPFPARCQGLTTPPMSGGWACCRPDPTVLQECPQQTTSDVREMHLKWMEMHTYVYTELWFFYV